MIMQLILMRRLDIATLVAFRDAREDELIIVNSPKVNVLLSKKCQYRPSPTLCILVFLSLPDCQSTWQCS